MSGTLSSESRLGQVKPRLSICCNWNFFLDLSLPNAVDVWAIQVTSVKHPARSEVQIEKAIVVRHHIDKIVIKKVKRFQNGFAECVYVPLVLELCRGQLFTDSILARHVLIFRAQVWMSI